MTSRARLSDAEIAAELSQLDAGWSHVPADGVRGAGCIERTLRFADFPAAMSFMVAVALAAEKMDHHPEWTNVYSRVTVRLSTHDAGGVTALDFALARVVDARARG